MQLDNRDKAALRALDDGFALSTDNETAAVTGEMQVAITRPADDRFWLRLTFPGGETLDVRIARAQLMQELGVGDGES